MNIKSIYVAHTHIWNMIYVPGASNLIPHSRTHMLRNKVISDANN